MGVGECGRRTCQNPGKFLRFAKAKATAAIFHIFFDAVAPRYRAKKSRTEDKDRVPAMIAPMPRVPAMAGRREAADMATMLCFGRA